MLFHCLIENDCRILAVALWTRSWLCYSLLQLLYYHKDVEGWLDWTVLWGSKRDIHDWEWGLMVFYWSFLISDKSGASQELTSWDGGIQEWRHPWYSRSEEFNAVFLCHKSYVPGSWFSDLLPHKGKLVHTVATIRVERRKKSSVGRIICLAWKKSAV